MAAVSGAWRALQESPQPYASSAIWGTGINPIHARRGGGVRHTTNGAAPSESYVPDNVLGDIPAYGYTGEEFDSGIFGYGTNTGTADRASWGTSGTGARARVTPGYPSPGQSGARIRSERHGGLLGYLSKLRSPRPITEGYQSKLAEHEPAGSVTAADSQLFIQTPAVQLHQTRRGSQRSGSQSEYRAPIESRVPGRRIPSYAGGERHSDMRPRTQTPASRRPFFSRTAGTGDPGDMRVNAAYQAKARKRTPPPGVPDIPDHASAALITGYGGYTSEDPLW